MASTSFKVIIYFRETKKLFTSIQSPGIGWGINRVFKNEYMQKNWKIFSSKIYTLQSLPDCLYLTTESWYEISLLLLRRWEICRLGSHLSFFLLFLDLHFIFFRKLSWTCFKWSSELCEMPWVYKGMSRKSLF